MSEPMLSRQNITSGKSLHIRTDATSCINSHSDPRVFIDSLKVAGKSLDKNLVAIDGGESVTASDKATGAACVIEANIVPGSINPTVSLLLGVLMDSATKSELEEKLSQVKNSGTTDIEIEFGSANKKQEFKSDEKWGIIADLSDFKFFPINPNVFEYKIMATELMGVAKNGMKYHLIEFEGLTTEKGDLNVCSAASTDKGTAKIGYIAV